MTLEPALPPHLRHSLGRLPVAARRYAQPGLIAALALVVRLHGLGDKPFWLDEIASLRRATGSIHDLVLDALHNHHYPSYFLLLWLVARLGTGEWLLRLPSAIFGALAAGVCATIGRRVTGSRGGAVAGILLALSPLEVQLGQEARSYTLASCLILVALWGLVCLAREPALALPGWRRGGLRGAWLAYCLGTAAALSVLGVAVPWLIAANLGAAAIAAGAGAARRPFLRQWVWAQGIVLVLWAPSLAALALVSKGSVTEVTGWAPSPTVAAVWATLAPVYLLRISNFISLDLAPAALPGLSLVVAALAGLGIRGLRRDPPVLAVLAAAAFGLPIGILLLSPLVPMLVPRYLAWSAAPFFVLAAAGLAEVSRVRFAAATAVASLCLLNLLPYYRYETKPRWDLAAARLASEAQPGDVALADRGYTYFVFSVFAERAGLSGRGIRVSRNLEEAQGFAAGHDVWALFGRIGQQAIGPPEDYLRKLASLGRPAAAYQIGRYITIYRFPVPPQGETDAAAKAPAATVLKP